MRLHWLTLFGCTWFYNKERKSCALQCKHDNKWYQTAALRRAIDWINVRYSLSETGTQAVANESLQYDRSCDIITHPSTANTIGQIHHWTHTQSTFVQPRRIDNPQQETHHHGGFSLSLSVSGMYTITPTSPTPRHRLSHTHSSYAQSVLFALFTWRPFSINQTINWLIDWY